VLQKAYGFSLPLLLLAVMILGLLGHSTRMWRACAMFGGCLLTVSLLSGLLPAKGVFLFLDAGTMERLPAHAGTFAFATFDLFRSGSPDHVSLSALNGVAHFPSFHTAAALILCHCCWPSRRLRVPLVAWSALVIVSTVPIGGHYLIDIAGGAAVFAFWCRLTRPRPDLQAADRLFARRAFARA
jgi:membrane-associated phospholipid phosphatase